MKNDRVSWALGCAVSVVALLSVAAAPAVADDFVCKQELMEGAWVTHGNLFGQGAVFGGDGDWSGVGLVVFDEQGFATSAIQTNTHGTTPSGGSAIDFLGDFGFELRFTVNPDCTGKYIFNDRSSGVLIFELDAVCGNGQRECHSTFTVTPPPGNTDPVGLVGVWTLERVDSLEVELDKKTDRLEDRITVIEGLVKRIAAAMYLISPKEAEE